MLKVAGVRSHPTRWTRLPSPEACPEFRKRMDEIGAEPIGNSAEQMTAQIKNETEKFARLVKDAKVTID